MGTSNNFNLQQEFINNLAKYERDKLLKENETGEYSESDDDSIFSLESNEESLEKVIIKNNVIVVSSLDRDWYNNTTETPFSFNVKLGNGLQNDHSFVDYEPKNIISIGIDSLLVNSRNYNNSYSLNNVNVSKFPYLSVSLENIDGVMYSTNNELNKSIGLMVPFTPSNNTVSYPIIEYKNSLNHTKEFYNNPMASLSKLDINIKQQTNSSPVEYNDVLSIKSITYSPAVSSNVATEYLVVETSNYFSNKEFGIGDIIQFRNYENINTGIYNNARLFNDYINRTSGHPLLDTSKTDTDKYLSNRIHIPIPSTISTSTGNVEEETWYTNFKSISLSNVSLSGSVTDLGGKLINTNLQNTLIFRIKTIEKESNFMNEDNLLK